MKTIIHCLSLPMLLAMRLVRAGNIWSSMVFLAVSVGIAMTTAVAPASGLPDLGFYACLVIASLLIALAVPEDFFGGDLDAVKSMTPRQRQDMTVRAVIVFPPLALAQLMLTAVLLLPTLALGLVLPKEAVKIVYLAMTLGIFFVTLNHVRKHKEVRP